IALINAVRSLSLERDKAAYYFIVRHNVRTYRSEGVVQVTKGRGETEKALKNWRDCQSSADYREGWRYFCEQTKLSTAIEPAEATELRQTQLQDRESKHSENRLALLGARSFAPALQILNRIVQSTS